eukprot:PhF_6_TR7026/c0_g1_i1/m.10505
MMYSKLVRLYAKHFEYNGEATSDTPSEFVHFFLLVLANTMQLCLLVLHSAWANSIWMIVSLVNDCCAMLYRSLVLWQLIKHRGSPRLSRQKLYETTIFIDSIVLCVVACVHSFNFGVFLYLALPFSFGTVLHLTFKSRLLLVLLFTFFTLYTCFAVAWSITDMVPKGPDPAKVSQFIFELMAGSFLSLVVALCFKTFSSVLRKDCIKAREDLAMANTAASMIREMLLEDAVAFVSDYPHSSLAPLLNNLCEKIMIMRQFLPDELGKSEEEAEGELSSGHTSSAGTATVASPKQSKAFDMSRIETSSVFSAENDDYRSPQIPPSATEEGIEPTRSVFNDSLCSTPSDATSLQSQVSFGSLESASALGRPLESPTSDSTSEGRLSTGGMDRSAFVPKLRRQKKIKFAVEQLTNHFTVVLTAYDTTPIGTKPDLDVLFVHILINAVKAHNGVVRRYMGGQLTATWCRSRATPRPFINAIKAAVFASQTLKNHKQRAAIGIDASVCASGSLGDSGLLLFNELCGPAVEQSLVFATLCDCIDGSVLVGDVILKEIRHSVLYRRVGWTTVSNVQENFPTFSTMGLDVYEILDLRSNEKDRGHLSEDEWMYLVQKEDRTQQEMLAFNQIVALHAQGHVSESVDELQSWMIRYPDDIVAGRLLMMADGL